MLATTTTNKNNMKAVSLVIGSLLLLAATTNAFPSPPTNTNTAKCGRTTIHQPLSTSSFTSFTSTSTRLNNMLRNYADPYYNDDPYDRIKSERSGASSTNWRKNQGYNLSKPTPPELGGTPYSTLRDAETNPYYDPGWAQSVRRDNPSQNYSSNSNYNGYNDPMSYENISYQYPSTYPGMTNPRRTDKMYTNPTNPYYDPVWSQSYDSQGKYGYRRKDVPIRDDDHTAYYAPGYDRNYYNGGGGGYYYGPGGGYYDDGMMMGGYGYGGGGYGRRSLRRGPPMMYAIKSSTNKKQLLLLNGNSFMMR